MGCATGFAAMVVALVGGAPWLEGPPAPPAAFDTLTIAFSGTWMPGRLTMEIQGTGAYTVSLPAARAGEAPYQAAAALSAQHLRTLVDALTATDWLAKPGLPDGGPAIDATSASFTLVRKGAKTAVTFPNEGRVPEAYGALLQFARRLRRQEQWVKDFATARGGTPSPGHELASQLEALEDPAGKARPPELTILDPQRFVPIVRNWLANPRGWSATSLATATKVVAHVRSEIDRPLIEALATGEVANDPDYEVPFDARVAAIRALGRLGAGGSLGILEDLAVHEEGGFRGAVAEALLSAEPAQAIPILTAMLPKTQPAAWVLIRMGPRVTPIIVEILERRPRADDTGGYYLIREYFEHWTDLPQPAPPEVLRAIQDHVERFAGRGAQLGVDYGLKVLQKAGRVPPELDARASIAAFLTAVGSGDTEAARRSVLLQDLHPQNAAAFLAFAAERRLRIQEVHVNRVTGLAVLTESDSAASRRYVAYIGRNQVWRIGSVLAVSPARAAEMIKQILRSYPDAKPLAAAAAEAALDRLPAREKVQTAAEATALLALAKSMRETGEPQPLDKPLATAPVVTALDEARQFRLYEDLGSARDATAAAGGAMLVAAGDAVVPFLAIQARPLRPTDTAAARVALDRFTDSPDVRRFFRTVWTLDLMESAKARETANRLRPPGQALVRGAWPEAWYSASSKARGRADLARGAFERRYRPGPSEVNADYVAVVFACREAIERFPIPSSEAYSRQTLVGLLQYTGRWDAQKRELETASQRLAGTVEEIGIWLSLGLFHLQVRPNPAAATPWFEKVRDAAAKAPPAAPDRAEALNLQAKYESWRRSAQYGLERCRALLAARSTTTTRAVTHSISPRSLLRVSERPTSWPAK